MTLQEFYTHVAAIAMTPSAAFPAEPSCVKFVLKY